MLKVFCIILKPAQFSVNLSIQSSVHMGAWWRHPCWPGRCQVCLRCSPSPDPSSGKYLVLTATQVLRPALTRLCGRWFVSRCCWPWEPVLAQSHVFVIARIIFWFRSFRMLAKQYILMVGILNIYLFSDYVSGAYRLSSVAIFAWEWGMNVARADHWDHHHLRTTPLNTRCKDWIREIIFR